MSIAVDPREAVKFPLPGELKGPGDRLKGESDTAHLYIIWAGTALDTTRIMQKEMKTPEFGRGELGAVDVPFETHLVHAVTERAFAEGNTAYVAGRVVKLELIQNDSTYLALPLPTREALFRVIRALNGGELTWLVHGEPEVGIKRHAEMEAFLENPTYRAPSKDPAAEAKTHMTKEGHKISEPFRPSLEDRGTPEADLKIEERVRKLEWDSTVEPQFTDILDRATEFYMDVPEELVDNDAIMLLPKLDSQREQLRDAYLMQPFMPRDSQPGGIFRASLMHYEKETDRLLQSADRGLTDERDDVRDTANKEREAASMARDYIEVLRRVSKQLLPG